jgi:hypothetical protein
MVYSSRGHDTCILSLWNAEERQGYLVEQPEAFHAKHFFMKHSSPPEARLDVRDYAFTIRPIAAMMFKVVPAEKPLET